MAVVKSPKNNKSKTKWILQKSRSKSFKTCLLNLKFKSNASKFKLSTFNNFDIHEKYITSKILNKVTWNPQKNDFI